MTNKTTEKTNKPKNKTTTNPTDPKKKSKNKPKETTPASSKIATTNHVRS